MPLQRSPLLPRKDEPSSKNERSPATHGQKALQGAESTAPASPQRDVNAHSGLGAGNGEGGRGSGRVVKAPGSSRNVKGLSVDCGGKSGSEQHMNVASTTGMGAGGGSQGIVASAIKSLPLDVGTVVSPTLSRSASDESFSLTVCKGGPGNSMCGLEVKNGQQGVQCDTCLAWYHAVCQDVPKPAFNALKKHQSLAFLCNACKRSLQPRPTCTTAEIAVQADNSGSCTTIVANHSTQTESSPCFSDPEASANEVNSYLVNTVSELKDSLRKHTQLVACAFKELEQASQEQSMIMRRSLTESESSKASYADMVKGTCEKVVKDMDNKLSSVCPQTAGGQVTSALSTSMFLVGLTGGIATGKSMVSKMMQEQGVPVVDADMIARQVVEPGTPALRQIKEAFGPDLLLQSGELDRTKLGHIIFTDPLKRKRLNKITHGKIQRRMMWETLKLFLKGYSFAILDLPLLFESGVAVDYMEKIVVVSCMDEVQLERLMLRSGQSEDDCRARIGSQMPLRLKRENAHFVIENSCSRAETAEQVRRVLEVLRSSRAHWRVRAVILLVVGGVTLLTLWLISLRGN